MADCISAHPFCANNRKQLENDSVCGCFFCGRIFNPAEITRWLSEKSGTALCPYCGVDAVIGECSGFPITDEFLREMHQYWFG